MSFFYIIITFFTLLWRNTNVEEKTWKFGLTILVYLGADKSGLCRDMLMVKVRILPEIGQKSEILFSNKVFSSAELFQFSFQAHKMGQNRCFKEMQ